ncbi:GAF domain-containing protein [Brucellaceae bacterium D45D]
MAKSSPAFQPIQQRLDEVARVLGVESVLIMKSTPTHMRVEASGGPQETTYAIGAEGRKGAAFEEAHELYCERVVKQDQPLFVRDSSQDAQWAGNEDEVEFGLRNYLGYPLHNRDGSVYGTVCVLHDTERDYSNAERQALEKLRDEVQAQIKPETIKK